MEGFRLFELECEAIRDAIRKERPDATAAEVQAMLCERFEARRRLENLLYPPPPGLLP